MSSPQQPGTTGTHSQAAAVQPGTTGSAAEPIAQPIAVQPGTTGAPAAPAAPADQPQAPAAPVDQGHGADSHYTVASGDSLSNIAASHGTDWQSLYSANQGVIGDDPNAIRPGETLNIPGHDLSADGHSNTAGVDLSGVGGAAEPASYDDWDAGAHSDTPDLDHPDFDHADHPVHDAGDVHDPNDFQTDQPDHIDDTWHHT